MFGTLIARHCQDYRHAVWIEGSSGVELRRVCRRLQLLSRMEHHEQDHEQVFP